MKTLAIFLTILTLTHTLSLIQLLGLQSLLSDLAKLNPTTNLTTPASSAYMLDPSIHTFLHQFPTRTEFCDYKCGSMGNLPCFMLFGCNIQLRNFGILVVGPLFGLAFTGLCCGKGIWTFSCWMHYLATVTGVRFIVWAVRQCAESGNGKSAQSDKQSQKQHQQEDDKNQQIKQEIDNDGNLRTGGRMYNRQSAASSSSSQK